MGFLNIPAFIFASLTGFLILVYLFNPKKVPLEVSSIIPWKELKDEFIRAKVFMPDFLFLIQLILLLLLIFTLARPYILVPHEQETRGSDYVLIIDMSASMQTREKSEPASEVPDTTRFQLAVKRAVEKIENMKEEDRMMILASSSHTKTVCTFTKDKETLIRAVESLKPDDTCTNIREGLDIAFAALRSLRRPTSHRRSNEQPSSEDAKVQAGKIAIISDGIGFSMPSAIPEGYEVEMIQVGEGSDNVAITSLEVYQDVFVSPDKREAYVTIKNFSDSQKDVDIVATLTVDSDGLTRREEDEADSQHSLPLKEIFKDRIKMLPGEVRTLTLTNIVSRDSEGSRRTSTAHMIRQGRLRSSDLRQKKEAADSDITRRETRSRYLLTVEIDADDLLEVDNKALNYVLKDRLLKVLLVTQSSTLSREFRSLAENSTSLDMVILPPAVMMNPKTKDIWREFDIAVFDRFTPPESIPINALYIIPRFSERVRASARPNSPTDGDEQRGRTEANPTSQGSTAFPIPKQRVDIPAVLDWDTSHPILKGLDYLDDIVISRAWVMDAPEWATVLARSGYRDNLTKQTGDFPLIFCGSPGEDRRRVVVITFELHSFDFTRSRNLSGLIMLLNIIRWLDPQNADLRGKEGLGNRYVVRTGEPFDLSLFPVASFFPMSDATGNSKDESDRASETKQQGAKLLVSGPQGQFDITSRESRIKGAISDAESFETNSPLIFTQTRYVGEYSVKAGDGADGEPEGENKFIVNFFHPDESDIKVRPYKAEEQAEDSHAPASENVEDSSESTADKTDLNSDERDEARLMSKDEDSKKKEIAKYAALIVLCFLAFEWMFYSLKKM